MTWHSLYHSRTCFWGKTDDSLGTRVIYNEEGGFTARDVIFKKETEIEHLVIGIALVTILEKKKSTLKASLL